MVGALIGVIIVLIVTGVIYWAVEQLLPLIPLPDPFRQIIRVLMILILVLIVIYVILMLLGGIVTLPGWLHVR